MGIDKTTYTWIQELESSFRILSKSSSIADLGPQDVEIEQGEMMVEENFKNIKTSRELYATWGFKDYGSFDLFDTRAEKADLNRVLDQDRVWDIVTNFGTSEHIFNQSAFMNNCHNLVSEGGFLLHAVPTSSGADHGFYNYHPTFFRSLATANNYSILDIRYVPFAVKQSKSKKKSYQFVKLGQQRHLREKRRIFLSKVRLICKPRNLILLFKPNDFYNHFFKMDILLVAFQKNSNTEFVIPIQERYI